MFLDWIIAFVSGGFLCLIGQILIDYTKLTPARILTGYVVAGVFFSAIGLYEPFLEFAGSGAAIPLTDFGHTLAQGVREAVDNDGFSGILTGGLSAASGGITAALFIGLIAAVIFKPKDN